MIASSGSWDDYTDWVDSCYIDRDIAHQKKDELNEELETMRNSPKFKSLIDETSMNHDVSTEIYNEWMQLCEQHPYRIEENIITDYYYTNRNDSIDDLLKD